MSFSIYSSYKPSGVEWLGQVPKHWRIAPLKYIVRLRSGGTPSKDNLNYWGGSIPWASAKDLKSEKLSDTLDHLADHAIEVRAAELVPEGAVLVLVRGMTLAHSFPVVLTLRPMAINQDLKAVIAASDVEQEYLAWLLRGSARESLSRVDEAGHGTKALRMEVWGSMLLPKPPLAEQRAITTFLERQTAKIDALAEEQQKLIELLQEKRQAVISHAVTKGLDPNAPTKDSGIEWPASVPAHWEILPLARVVSQFVDYRGKTPAKIDDGVPLVTATQIKEGRIDHSLDPVFISEEEYAERMTRGFPEKGDVLVTTEAPLGETAQIEDERVALGQRIILMKPNKSKITADYLFTHFRSQFGSNELWKRASGSTASGIRADRLRASAVLVPPLDEQSAIVSWIAEKVSHLPPIERAIQQQIKLLQERRRALISAAVTGKIDVRGLVEADLPGRDVVAA
jgi:type I restriction enzyme, S subunit